MPSLEIGKAEERENQWLAREAAIGYAQLESGETVTIETREQFKSLAMDFKRHLPPDRDRENPGL